MTLKVCPQPCPSCPWRRDQTARDIPNFELELAEGLSKLCPDADGRPPHHTAALFACHQSKEGAEIVCAGWLAMVGEWSVRAVVAKIDGRLDPAGFAPRPGWPDLHTNYPEVLEKLRATAPAGKSRRNLRRKA